MDSNKNKKSASKFSGFAWLWHYLSRHKKIFIPSLAALLFTAGLSLVFPFFLRKLIGDPADALRKGIEVNTLMKNINRDVLVILGVLCVQAAIGFWRVRGFITAGEAALNDLRRDVFAKLMALPISFYHEQRSGELSNRVSADLSVVRDTLINTVPQAARQSVIFIGGLGAVLYFSWKLSLLMLSSVPLVVIGAALLGRQLKKQSKAAQDALAFAGSTLEEAVQNIADVKAYANEALESQRYDKCLSQFYSVAKTGAKMRGIFLSFIIFAMFGTIAVVTWLGARMLAHGEITNLQFVSFILFSVFVGASLGSFPEIMAQMNAMNGATERLREVLEMTPERSGGKVLENFRGSVQWQDVHFRYPSRMEKPVLNGVTFSVDSGKRIALVGSSGAGKSTVFSLLCGFYAPESGSICFDDENISSLDLQQLRKQMAVVPQEVALFGGSIQENIAYGKPGASEEEIIAAAKIANAHEFITAQPEGYETLVGPRGVKLSGGQKQRISIARAVLANPKLLLLDEATSALDAESERLVNEALERLMKDRTAIVIAHRLSTVRNADTILVMHQGKIIESGNHDALMAMNGHYRVLVETQLL